MNDLVSLNDAVNRLLQEGQAGLDDDSRVVLDGGNQVRVNGRISAVQFRSGAQKQQNVATRRQLLDALLDKFESIENIPDSVKRAMKLDEFASGFSTSRDGKSVVVGNRPLSVRRIRAILDAAGACESTARVQAGFSPHETLRALTGPALDRSQLAKSLDVMQHALDRLVARGEILPVDTDRVAEGFMKTAVEGLSNRDLLAAYEKMGSDEYRAFSRSLNDSARCNLFTLDALITREIGRRAIGGAERGGGEGDLPARNMLALANVSVTSKGRKEQVAGTFASSVAPSCDLDASDLKKAGDFLRNSPLTMNVSAKFFFSKTGPLSNLGGIWKNLFHALEEGKDVKGPGYVAKRNQIEAGFYPEFGTCSGLKARERPTYAALNSGRLPNGAAPSYGSVAIKFREDVKKRAVYTVNDSFSTLPVEINEDRKKLFLKSMTLVSGLSDEAREKLSDAKGAVVAELTKVVDELIRTSPTTADKVWFDIKDFSDDDNRLLTAALLDFCKVTGGVRSKNSASFDNLESLLPNMDHADAVRLINAARNEIGHTKMGYNYIEAQIHGDIHFPDDIEEIVIDETTYDGEEDFDYVKAQVEILNGRKVGSAELRKFTPEQRADLDALRRQLGGRTIPVRIASEDEMQEAIERYKEDGSLEVRHFDLDGGLASVDGARGDPAASRKLVMSQLPVSGFDVGDDFALSNDMANRIKARLRHHAGHRSEIPKLNQTDIEGIVGLAYRDVIGPKMLERLKKFVREANPPTEASRAVVGEVLNGRVMTLAEMRERIGIPEFAPFPQANHPERLPQDVQGRRGFLLSMLPVYHEHEKPGGFDYGAGYHSRGHICRAFIFAETMADILETRGRHVDRAAVAMGIVGHDSGRTQNGRDTEKMETQSARNTVSYAHKAYGGDSTGEAYDREIADCIVSHRSPTVEGMLLNSADSLDIGRTKDFDMKYFQFLKGESETGDPVDDPVDNQLRHDLQKEAQLLAVLTDPRCATNRMRFEISEDQGMELEEQVDRLRELDHATQEDIIELSEMDDESFVRFVENEIRKYPDVFPLLTEHYLNKLPAA